jgi:radical SAM protein with 4Fe4S-binding SPASM domain
MLVPAGRGIGLSDIALSSGEYEKALRTVADLKANSQIDVRFTCGPRFAAVFPKMYPESKKKAFGCLAASDFAFISHAGDVQTCGFLKISAGNILQSGNFGEIWEKSEFLNTIRQKKFKGKCGDCDFVNVCGGCRARAFAQTGDCLESDPLCSYKSAVSTLVAAHVEEDKINEAADAINTLKDVSHNYLRKHNYNVWFTLKSANVDKILKDLSGKFNTEFYSFPSIKHFKLDREAIKKHQPPVNYNALVCCKGDGQAAKFLCDLPQVSHCYERQTLPNWPYNLYAMVHEKSNEAIETLVAQFITQFKISEFQILPTIKSLKTN